MAKEKETFIMYKKYRKPISKLNAEQKANLLDAIFAFQCNEDIPDLDMVTEMLFELMQDEFKRDGKKYEEICAKRSAAVRKRWDDAAREFHPQNRFNNFQQRDYTKEEFATMEREILKKQLKQG